MTVQLSSAKSGPSAQSADETNSPEVLDRYLHAVQAHFTGFLSPASLLLAFADWQLHLANSPARRLELMKIAGRQWARLGDSKEWIEPGPQDHRFRDKAWSQPPFNYMSQAFLLGEEWWCAATKSLPGVTKSHSDMVAFATRQMLDIFSPSNFPWTNPEVLRATKERRGHNLMDGFRNFLDDGERITDRDHLNKSTNFEVGKDVAITPGKVVFRNALMELIQYAPMTELVRPEPILIVPAWIMKYYILDLSPNNSFIHYLVSQGYTVFCISWRNPGPQLRNTSLDDYRRLGVMAALDAVNEIAGLKKIHACGYCLGGTLLSIAAAAMRRDGDERLATLTMLAAQTDFTEAGELQLFTDESQLALLDDVMWHQGFLNSKQMAGTFQMLRSSDLIWSRLIKTYLIGQRDTPNDLMAWNEDATRMPFRMHSEYLHSLFLHNDLAEGRYMVEGKPAAISEITAPIFAVSTETDHVAPWRSVYKIHLLNEGEITFVLTSGGHNAGIVSEPGHPSRHFRIAHRSPNEPYLAAETWEALADKKDGSWWPSYATWLGDHSTTKSVAPQMGTGNYSALGDAPGKYARER